MVDECQKDRDPGRGRCCCNCKFQLEVMRHPWNMGFAKGGMAERLGFACAALEEGGRVIFFDGEHGKCELHEHKGKQ